LQILNWECIALRRTIRRSKPRLRASEIKTKDSFVVHRVLAAIEHSPADGHPISRLVLALNELGGIRYIELLKRRT
jgi:hypothetical protein